MIITLLYKGRRRREEEELEIIHYDRSHGAMN